MLPPPGRYGPDGAVTYCTEKYKRQQAGIMRDFILGNPAGGLGRQAVSETLMQQGLQPFDMRE